MINIFNNNNSQRTYYGGFSCEFEKDKNSTDNEILYQAQAFNRNLDWDYYRYNNPSNMLKPLTTLMDNLSISNSKMEEEFNSNTYNNHKEETEDENEEEEEEENEEECKQKNESIKNINSSDNFEDVEKFKTDINKLSKKIDISLYYIVNKYKQTSISNLSTIKAKLEELHEFLEKGCY